MIKTVIHPLLYPRSSCLFPYLVLPSERRCRLPLVPPPSRRLQEEREEEVVEHVQDEEEGEEGVAVDVEGVKPLDRLLGPVQRRHLAHSGALFVCQGQAVGITRPRGRTQADPWYMLI